MQICSGRWWWPRVDDAAGPGSAGHLPRQEQPPYGHKPLVARVDHLFGHKLGVDPPDVLTIADPLLPCTMLDISLRHPTIVRPSKNNFEPSGYVYSTAYVSKF